MTEYTTRSIAIAVLPKNQPIYSEQCTTVCIVDESAGEFVEVRQEGRTDIGKISINPEEWPALRQAIDAMIEQCKDDGREE